ncbi:hypothetical protein CT154_00475 [Komagataeibacter xylinus]|nr:hypothetical protein CT154_00475 [Komagataeibacter xylinus]
MCFSRGDHTALPCGPARVEVSITRSYPIMRVAGCLACARSMGKGTHDGVWRSGEPPEKPGQ